MHVTVNDLTQLDELNTDAGKSLIVNGYPCLGHSQKLLSFPFTVKRCLRGRYFEKKFYTWAGPTLVALNPLREITSLYSREIVEDYAHETVNPNKPQIFAIGQLDLRHLQMNLGKGHQAIIVNGESGAGKVRQIYTTSKYIIN